MIKDCSECKHFDVFHTSRACHKCKPWLASTDYISRADAIEAMMKIIPYRRYKSGGWTLLLEKREVIKALSALPSAESEKWSLCDEMSPKELAPMLVTWVNHSPPEYYKHIKDMPLVDTAVYYRGGWYWWDATLIDILGEYGEDCGAELIDKDIEIIAWMPLPKPYKGGDTE